MDRCQATKQSEAVTILSTPFSLKPAPENTSHEPFSSIWNQLWWMKSELEPTDNFSTPNNLLPVKKTPLTTTPEVTTPSVKNSSIWCSTEPENSPISALVSKDF